MAPHSVSFDIPIKSNMATRSLDVLRPIRDRMERSFLTHPDFQVRFAFGVQTSFDKVDHARWDARWDDGSGRCFPNGPLWNWEFIGRRLELKNLVDCRHSGISGFLWANDPSAWPKDRGPCRSSLIDGLYASEGHDATLRRYLDDLDALQGWLVNHYEEYNSYKDYNHRMLYTSWHGFVCLMKLACPSRFTFHLSMDVEPDDPSTLTIPTLSSPDDFWRVSLLESHEPPAVYLMLPSMDARTCSIEVIDAILARCDGAEVPLATGTEARVEPTRPPEPSVVLGGPGDKPIVRGVEKEPLGEVQFDVIRVLVEAGQRGLTKDALMRRSGHTDAVGVIERLRKKDPDWASVIQMAGKPGRRYRIIP